jgi:hypothetical protein
MPAAGLAAINWRTAIKRNATECTRATTARLRFVKMENSTMLELTVVEMSDSRL